MNDLREATGIPPRPIWPRIAVGIVLVMTMVLVTILLGEKLSLDSLAKQETELRKLRLLHPVIVYAVALLIYVSVTGLSIPVASALTLLCGWYFGFWRGVVVVSFGSTAGAT